MINARDVFGVKDGIGIDIDRDLPGASDIKEALADTLSELDWPMVRNHVARSIGSLFDIDVIDVLLRAWTTRRVLEEYADTKKHPPNEESFIALTDHDIESRHHPEIDIMVGDAVIKTIKFDLTITLTLEGVILVVQNARITHLRSARILASAVLACRGVKLFEKKAALVELPGEWPLGDGIDLRGLAGGDRSAAPA